MNTYNVFCGICALYSFIALFNQGLFNLKLLIGVIVMIIVFYIVTQRNYAHSTMSQQLKKKMKEKQ